MIVLSEHPSTCLADKKRFSNLKLSASLNSVLLSIISISSNEFSKEFVNFMYWPWFK